MGEGETAARGTDCNSGKGVWGGGTGCREGERRTSNLFLRNSVRVGGREKRS